MKSSKMKKATKRILAMLLCTSMVLSSGVSASADEGVASAKEQGHVHTEACYEKNKTDNLICTKAETAEGHVHGDACYEVTSSQELTCTLTETAGHAHGDGCVETTQELTCGQEEHSHDDGCYTTETKAVCNDESEEHTCGDACIETEEVLTCTAEEHSHNDGCYETETNLICGQEEVEAHAHGEGCYTLVESETLVCTLEETEIHPHGDDCYQWEDTLICTLAEAEKAEETSVCETCQKVVCECVEEVKEDLETEENAVEEVEIQNTEAAEIKVSIKSTTDVLGKDTKVVVEAMEADEVLENVLAEAAGELNVLGCMAYDISLEDAEGNEVELGEHSVETTIEFEEAQIPEGIDAETVSKVVLLHITEDDEEEKLIAEEIGEVEITEEKAVVGAKFETDSFSPYVVTWMGTETTDVRTLEYEDEEVRVVLTAAEDALEGVAGLSVTPIREDDEATKEQYAEVAQQLAEKVTKENKENNQKNQVVGFLAYDITLVDNHGNKLEPQGEVKVSMEYREAAVPEKVESTDAIAVTIHHFEEDENGQVKQIVDMVAEGTIEAALTITENVEVKNAVFVTDSFSTFAITWEAKEGYTILDVNNQNITDGYRLMLQTMLNKIETKSITDDVTNLPILNWERSSSSSSKYVTAGKASSETDWKWENVADALKLDIQDPARVWDGSRLDSTGEVVHYYNYLETNMVTAYQDVLYDSATWKLDASNENNQAQMYRFRGEFDIGEGNPNEFTYTLKPVTGGDKIYINDDIFVFVYPKDVEINDDNFMDYLAFWTGTVNQGNNNFAFHGRYGTVPTHGPKENLAYVTDGWYLTAISDNAGAIIQNIYNEYAKNSKTAPQKYYVDVITDDYQTGGGMYRLLMEQKLATKYPVSFKKTDLHTGNSLEGVKFAFDLINASGQHLGVHYTAVSNANGEVSLNLVPGIYRMTEESAPENYAQNTSGWKIVVQEDGSYTITTYNDQNQEVPKTDDKYIITNERIARDVEVLKVNESADGLPDAEFTIYNDASCTTIIQTATTNQDGVATFKGIAFGTYYLCETAAPEGYIRSTEVWTITVDEDGYSIKNSKDEEVRSIVNHINKQSIEITKRWNDFSDFYKKRPQQIEFELQYKYEGEDDTKWNVYQSENQLGNYIMKRQECEVEGNENDWKYTIQDLPIVNPETEKTYVYRVVEKTDVSANGYIASTDGLLTMVNTIETKIVKRSSTSTDNNQIFLEGAVFEVKGTATYYGKSDENGIVQWYESFDEKTNTVSQEITSLPDGTYELSELIAPSGYMVNTCKWTIDVEKGVLKINGKSDENDKTQEVEFYFDNTPLYELPSTGGHGIYTTMLSGFAIMLGAAYVWFTNRREEMLK